MIFYTADLHFGYAPVLESAQRPFASIDAMNESLIKNWNAAVSPEDTVYVLGDIGAQGTPIPEDCLNALKGKKHLIRGNHDTGLEHQEQLFRWFETVTDFLEVDDGGIHITLCHYPIVYIQRGLMIHGHLHNAKKEAFPILKQLPRVLNAGVDVNNYRPVTLEELIRNNRAFYQDAARDVKELIALQKQGRRKPDFRPLPVKPNTFDFM